jgi:hypothetical protein
LLFLRHIRRTYSGSDREIAQATGVPKGTVNDIRQNKSECNFSFKTADFSQITVLGHFDIGGEFKNEAHFELGFVRCQV